MRFRRAALAAALAAALGAAAVPAAAQAPPSPPAAAEPASHPFYVQLLDDGVYTYQRGDHGQAARDLRLAVFGLLEEPPRLVRGLAYLALAQAAGGEPAAARETLGRLLSIEERFRVYAGTELGDGAREAFEALLLAEVPEATLAASPTFRRLGDEKFLRRLAALPPREHRPALEQKAAAQPDEPRWQLALAELDLAAKQPAEAVRRATAALGLDPGNAAARCVRGLALVETGACETAVADLDLCPRSRGEAPLAQALLGCQAELGRWQEAAAFIATLQPQVRGSNRALTRLERRVEREAARLQAAAAEVAQGGEAVQQPAGTGIEATAEPPVETASAPANGAAAPAAGTPLPAAAEARLDEARSLLAAATRAADLQTPLALAREVADAHPGSRAAQHLVGEIAYRASRWRDAAAYFRRGGEPERPELRFYMAVALYESGERQAAAEILERALPELPRSPFVTSYVERIQAGGAP